MAAFDQATRALLKIDYEEGDETLVVLGVKYNVTASYISRVAREQGWLLRSVRLGRRPRRMDPLTNAGRALISHRLCGVINTKLDQMEKDMESGELSSTDLERDAKTIASMIGGMEKVKAGPGEDKVSKPDVARSVQVANADEVERLQREIVERFERIQKRRETERGSQ